MYYQLSSFLNIVYVYDDIFVSHSMHLQKNADTDVNSLYYLVFYYFLFIHVFIYLLEQSTCTQSITPHVYFKLSELWEWEKARKAGTTGRSKRRRTRKRSNQYI